MSTGDAASEADDVSRCVLTMRKERTTLASLSHSFLTSLYECGSRVARQTFLATSHVCRRLITLPPSLRIELLTPTSSVLLHRPLKEVNGCCDVTFLLSSYVKTLRVRSNSVIIGITNLKSILVMFTTYGYIITCSYWFWFCTRL